jgi:hypothetical protein
MVTVSALSAAKKKSVISPEADNGFFCFKDSVRPLSTSAPAADNNYSAEEYENKVNKVANGNIFVHGILSVFTVCYCVAG